MKHQTFTPLSDETIIFLHGGNVAGWMWGAQVPAFDDYHLLVPDYPGFGASTTDHEGNDDDWVSIADTADRVAALIAHHARGSRAHVVGLSLGSSVAIELALRHPDAVASLFLASTSVTRIPALATLATRVMLTQWEREGFWRSLARTFRLPEDSVELFVTTGLGIKRSAAEAIYREVSTPIAAERLARLARLSAPVLAVAGSKDSASVRRDSLDALSSAGVRTAVAPGMHHQWNIENVELFNSAVRCWIESGDVVPGLGARI